MFDRVYDYLENISIGLSIIPFLFLMMQKNAVSGVKRYFFSLFIIELACEFSLKVLGSYNMNNYFVIHFYTFLYGLILVLIFNHFLVNRKVKLFSWVLVLFLFISFAYEFFWKDGYLGPNTMSYVVLGSLGIYLALAGFLQILNDTSIKSLGKSPFYVLCGGILFYFGTTLSLSIFESFILFNDSETLYLLWSVQLFANIMYYLIITRVIWLMKGA
jgi:hypothetical protein